jgi:hypothetical protein
MKLNITQDTDLDSFIASRYPKLPLPVGRTEFSKQVDISIREADIYEVTPATFDLEKLYLREH